MGGGEEKQKIFCSWCGLCSVLVYWIFIVVVLAFYLLCFLLFNEGGSAAGIREDQGTGRQTELGYTM